MSASVNICKRLFLLLVVAAWPMLGQAVERHYAADMVASKWSVDGTTMECRLSHAIPYYGEAVFSRQAGKGDNLQLAISVDRGPNAPSEASLVSAPPTWKHDAREIALGKVAMVSGTTPFTMQGPQALRLFYELENGMFPTLRYKDWADSRDDISVSLSSVNFQAALSEFKACSQTLLGFTLDDVKELAIFFDSNSTRLGRWDRKRLDRVAEYLAADPSVTSLVVTGYADNRGMRRFNKALSQRRAESVRDYLVKQGVPADKFELRHFGEKNPTYSNKMAEGRKKNRRVTIVLHQ